MKISGRGKARDSSKSISRKGKRGTVLMLMSGVEEKNAQGEDEKDERLGSSYQTK